MPTFGERILILRRRNDLTQRELAKMAGINSKTLARVERGEVKDLAGQAIAKLARALGCSGDYLLGLTEDEEEERQYAHA